jgi:transcriptional regulator with XRE-family HTH domain
MFRAPSQAGLPDLATLLADLPATPQQIAHHLGVSLATLKRWERDGQAPRPVMLALFWESRWGRSAADCEAAQYGSLMYQAYQASRNENAALRRQMVQLELELASSGAGSAANTPFFQPGSTALAKAAIFPARR